MIHFVGGNFLGLYPRSFYDSLLEGILCKCNAVAVATPIPTVLLPGVDRGLTEHLGRWIFNGGGNIYDYDNGGGGGRG